MFDLGPRVQRPKVQGAIVPVLIFPILVACAGLTAQSAEPRLVSAAELSTQLRGMPSAFRFTISGVGFYQGQVYATTNLGLLVVQGNAIDHVLQWGRSTLSGPWLDSARNRLWVQRDDNGSLLRLDTGKWSSVPMPPPARGYYSRGDMLTGFGSVDSVHGFWIVGGGGASRFDETGNWTPEPLPPIDRIKNQVLGAAMVGEHMSFVVIDGSTAVPFPQPHALYEQDAAWKSISLGEFEFRQVVGVDDTVYVRAKDGSLLAVRHGEVRKLPTLAPCEVIARTTSGTLLAVFTNQGFFTLVGGQWTKKAPYPSDVGDGEHTSYVAEFDGHLAFATMSNPHIKPGSDPIVWTYTGVDALWTIEDGKIARVIIR